MSTIEKISDIFQEYYKILNVNPKKSITITEWFRIADEILKKIDIKELYIKLDDSVSIPKLKFFRDKKLQYNQKELLNTSWKHGNIYLNENYKEKVCTNIKMIEFNSMYPMLLMKLIDNDIITLNDKKYYTIFKFFLINRIKFKQNLQSNFLSKSFINFFYGILSYESACVSEQNKRIDCINFKNFEIYKHLLYLSIKNQLQNNLIYLDTDQFYYIDDNYTFNFDIPYEIENIDEFILFGKKKFIKIINKNTYYEGFIKN